jgi:hypothetical protein
MYTETVDIVLINAHILIGYFVSVQGFFFTGHSSYSTGECKPVLIRRLFNQVTISRSLVCRVSPKTFVHLDRNDEFGMGLSEGIRIT